MKAVAVWFVACSVGAFAAQAATNSPPPPPWAYPVPAGPAAPPAQDTGAVLHVPGSDVGLTLTQVRNLSDVPVWHPDDHPPLPDVVKHGRAPAVRACGYCHLPNGQGRPENSFIAGLNAAYIKQQIADFRSGARKSSVPEMGP